MKIKTKHTPGPWRTGERYPCRVFTDRKSVSERQPIASTCEAQDEGTETEEQIVNARLIAAAPDLLEICNKILNFPKPFGAMTIDLHTVSELCAAIAKAEGRAL